MKTDYSTTIIEMKKNIPDVTGLVTTATLNAKATEIENKIPDITNLATKAALKTKATVIEGKTPDITNLPTKADLNTKATQTENKIPDASGFITTPEFNRIGTINFDAKMKEAEKSLATKVQSMNAIDIAIKNKEIKGLQTFDSGYISGKSHFPKIKFKIIQCFNQFSNTSKAWTSNGLSKENIKSPTTSNNSLAPGMSF